MSKETSLKKAVQCSRFYFPSLYIPSDFQQLTFCTYIVTIGNIHISNKL